MAPLSLTLAAFLFAAAALTANAQDKPAPKDDDKSPGIVIVTTGQLGFDHNGTFYPVGVPFKELTRTLGKPSPTQWESLWRYETLRLSIGLSDGIGSDYAFQLDEMPGWETISPNKIVTDRGISHTSSYTEVIKARGKPTREGERNGFKFLH